MSFLISSAATANIVNLFLLLRTKRGILLLVAQEKFLHPDDGGDGGGGMREMGPKAAGVSMQNKFHKKLPAEFLVLFLRSLAASTQGLKIFMGF